MTTANGQDVPDGTALFWGVGVSPDISGSGGVATGTRITTARGEVPVEELRVGDLVLALRGRRFVDVVRTGQRNVQGDPQGSDAAAWPVRVVAGAFAADLPYRELTLAPDHALYIDGSLVPARFLVNGGTVTQAPMADISYWHVELATHDVLRAEGLPAESHLGAELRETRACAPLQREPAAHRLIRKRLLARAAQLGFATTDDPDLRVFAGDGRLPLRRTGFTWHCDLPPDTRAVRLLSRGAVPAEILADGTDRRRLGVAVTHLTLDGETIGHGDARRAEGWHQPEPVLQWTDGAAVLLCDRPGSCLRRLEITIAPLLRYWAPTARVALAA